MDTLLQGLKGVADYIDDILISNTSPEEHLKILEEVLTRLQAAGLGHKIDADGIHPMQDKVKAIQEAPLPKNLAELRSFLGLINYYGKFLPNLSLKLTPLYLLLKRKQKWEWSMVQVKAFQAAQETLQGDALLVHYDTQKPLILVCDASQYGIGAVLSHAMPDKQERPIAYASEH